MNKKAYYFTIDALIALVVILGIVLFIKPQVTQVHYESRVQDDFLQSLSTVKVGDLDNAFVQSLIASGDINNTNQSVLEQIGEFYANGNPNAEALAQDILDDLSLREHIALYFDNNLIANNSPLTYNEANTIVTSRYLISGIQNGSGATGYSSSATLFAENKIHYFYFGGYVGDGNLTAYFNLLLETVLAGRIEGAFSGNFSLYINNHFIGDYAPIPNQPFPIELSPTAISYFSNINPNYVEFRSPTPLYIAGGYIKLVTDSTVSLPPSRTEFLPGIEGIINLYDSFYVPGNLTGLNVSLHLNTTHDVFLTIGNQTIYEGNTSGTLQTITINNATLASALDYDFLSEKTTPFRLGLRNASYVINISINTDVFSVTDLSGSMEFGCADECLDGLTCGDPLCNSADCPICNAKEANYALVEGILNNSNNRAGLAGYETIDRNNDFHELSNNDVSLESLIETQWDAYGGTCICCGINRALRNFYWLMGYYQFEGNAEDSSAQNEGVIHGNPSYVSGRDGLAMSFDGSTDYISVENMVLEHEGSISFWFRPHATFDSSSATTQGIWSKYRDSSDHAFIALKGNDIDPSPWYITIPNGVLFARFREDGVGTSSYLESSTTTWDANTWYHIAISYDGITLALYVNGVLEDSTPLNYRFLRYDGQHSIGRSQFESAFGGISYDGEPRYLDGDLDEFRVFGKGLTQEEVLGLMDVTPSCGNGLVEAGEICDDGNSDNEDRCMVTCTYPERNEVMIVMSDGAANRLCDAQSAASAAGDAEEAACDAYEKYGITVHSVAFGDSVDQQTLQDIRNCGNGNYYEGDVEDIITIYQQIANDVIQASYSEQTVIANGLFTKLYPDSYFAFDYEKEAPWGLIVTAETPMFGSGTGTLTLPLGSEPYEVRAVSYSSSKWTSRVSVNNSATGSWQSVYDLSTYNTSFTQLGDPYVVNIPSSSLVSGNNLVNISIGLSTTNYSSGSPYNKVIYSVLKNYSSASPILPAKEGCIWHIEFPSGASELIHVPTDYSGTNVCAFNSTLGAVNDYVQMANPNDALEYAVFLLLRDLDLNDDGVVETHFTEDQLNVTSNVYSGIPFTWGTEVQARSWL